MNSEKFGQKLDKNLFGKIKFYRIENGNILKTKMDVNKPKNNCAID